MKLIVQRVDNASVTTENGVIGEINKGLLVFIGITHDDTEENADFLVKKLCNLRIFQDENDKMNMSVKDVAGEILVVSQFTLYADCKKGNRPSFVNSADPNYANKLYEYFIKKCKNEVKKVETGEFGAHMMVKINNNGPVTIILEK